MSLINIQAFADDISLLSIGKNFKVVQTKWSTNQHLKNKNSLLVQNKNKKLPKIIHLSIFSKIYLFLYLVNFNNYFIILSYLFIIFYDLIE